MELTEMSVTELSRLLGKKEISSSELTSAYLERIHSDGLNTYITVTEEYALSCAAEADKRLVHGERLHPLDGIPFSVKDNLCTKGMRTTCASKMLENFTPNYDATAVARLKDKGAVMLGKVNLDEFAMGISTETSYFGRVKNPLDRERSAGGSSGGSAAAVAAGECAFSLGTDTGGSIRQPASYCGVVGMSPTYGRVSRFGLVAFASSLDRVGVVTKNISDNALVLSAISGADSNDTTSVDVPAEIMPSEDGAENLTVYIPEEFLSVPSEAAVGKCFGNAADIYRSLGATVKYVSIPELRYCLDAYSVLSCAEASSNLARFDGIRYGYGSESGAKSIDEVRSEAFGGEVKARVLFGTLVLGERRDLYEKALCVRQNVTLRLGELLAGKNSVILAPATNRTAFRYGDESGNTLNDYSDFFSVSANLAGLPAAAFPFGKGDNGLPIGMQLFGAKFAESTLYGAAKFLERVVAAV